MHTNCILYTIARVICLMWISLCHPLILARDFLLSLPYKPKSLLGLWSSTIDTSLSGSNLLHLPFSPCQSSPAHYHPSVPLKYQAPPHLGAFRLALRSASNPISPQHHIVSSLSLSRSQWWRLSRGIRGGAVPWPLYPFLISLSHLVLYTVFTCLWNYFIHYSFNNILPIFSHMTVDNFRVWHSFHS